MINPSRYKIDFFSPDGIHSASFVDYALHLHRAVEMSGEAADTDLGVHDAVRGVGGTKRL